MDTVRIDKWLWAVRIYKTRALASEACRKGRVLVNGLEAKPSKELKVGDKVTVRKLPVLYNYKVLKLAEKRMGGKLVSDHINDLTTIEELNKLKIKETVFIKRDRGAGRPTKKERRELDDLTNTI